MSESLPAIQQAPEAEAIIKAARMGAEPSQLDGGLRYLAFDAMGSPQVFDFTADPYRFLDGHCPIAHRGQFLFTEAAGFIDYINSHAGNTGRTELWADRRAGRVVAVLDGHQRISADAPDSDPSPGWGLHRAQLTLAQTPEWQEWTKFSETGHAQDAFADFLEDHLLEVVEPSAADLLEIATSISVTSGIKFSQATRLASGEVSFSFTEEHDAKAGRTQQLKIPKTISLALSPFEGVDPYKATARFRYTLREGKLTLRLILDRPHEILKAAFADAVKAIEDGTGLTVYHGAPANPLVTI
jgi:uncharacterized protein YfdQ (DUF2303 family)